MALKKAYYSSTILFTIFSANGINILANGTEMAVPTNEDFKNAIKKPDLNP